LNISAYAVTLLYQKLISKWILQSKQRRLERKRELLNVLDINVIKLSEPKNSTVVFTISEPLFQKARLLNELDEVQKSSI
jgi:hypothetical protein